MDALHYVMSHLKAAQIKTDERGVTAIEYALIAALIGIVIIVGASQLGTTINGKFSTISASISAAGK
ncbi:MAG TPA: Flp family type IVb pilin [Acetobacteraceae bacterium]